jgi:hypothetical protein
LQLLADEREGRSEKREDSWVPRLRIQLMKCPVFISFSLLISISWSFNVSERVVLICLPIPTQAWTSG